MEQLPAPRAWLCLLEVRLGLDVWQEGPAGRFPWSEDLSGEAERGWVVLAVLQSLLGSGPDPQGPLSLSLDPAQGFLQPLPIHCVAGRQPHEGKGPPRTACRALGFLGFLGFVNFLPPCRSPGAQYFS